MSEFLKLRGIVVLFGCLLCLAAWAGSAKIESVKVDTDSRFKGKEAIKVTLATVLTGYKDRDVVCQITIYDTLRKKYLTTTNRQYMYGDLDLYTRRMDLHPDYTSARYNDIWFYIEPDDVKWGSGAYQIIVTMYAGGDIIEGSIATGPFAYISEEVEEVEIAEVAEYVVADTCYVDTAFIATTIVSLPQKPAVAKNASTTKPSPKPLQKSVAKTAANPVAKNTHQTTSTSDGKYRYYESSRTGKVALASVYNLPDNSGGERVINGFGGVYVYVGMVNGEQKWSTFTTQPIYEEKRIQGFGSPVKISTGRYKIVPDNRQIIFTKPDLSVVRTITDTFDKQISRNRWLKLNGSPSSPSVTPGTTSPTQTSPGRTEYQRTPHNGYAQCRHCNGTGRCSTCNGTGDRADTHNREPNKVVWRCTTCSGSGQCMFCHGSGRIRN